MTEAERSPAQRAADHAAIDHLAGELVPALIAKLGATNLGEIEVREGDWRVRLRRPAPSNVNYGRRASDRPSRAHPGHEGHGHAPAALEVHRQARGATTTAQPSGGGGVAALAAVGPGRPTEAASERSASGDRGIARSPAVGVFVPLAAVATGARVHAGDRLGTVEVLGVAHEVLAPADGIVGATLVEAGHAVEYGQELVRLEATSMGEAGT